MFCLLSAYGVSKGRPCQPGGGAVSYGAIGKPQAQWGFWPLKEVVRKEGPKSITKRQVKRMTVEIRCPYCGYSKDVPREKIPPNAKWAVCPRCSQRFEIFQDVVFEQVGPKGEDRSTKTRGRSPWERRDGLGFWQASWQTFKLVLFSPGKMFGSLTYQGGMRDPLAFGLLAGSVGSMFGFFWQLMLMSLGAMAFSAPLLGHLGMWSVLVVMVIFVPIVVFIGIFLYSAILHLLLLIVRGGGNGFEATFRVVCYAQAVQVLGVVPLLGGWSAGIWQLIVQIIGLKEIHETSYLRVIVAFLIPVVFVVVLILAVLIPIIFHFMQTIHLPSGTWS